MCLGTSTAWTYRRVCRADVRANRLLQFQCLGASDVEELDEVYCRRKEDVSRGPEVISLQDLQCYGVQANAIDMCIRHEYGRARLDLGRSVDPGTTSVPHLFTSLDQCDVNNQGIPQGGGQKKKLGHHPTKL